MPDSRWKLISICTLREEGDVAQKLGELIDKISIHALREEGDPERAPQEAGRGAISIHALREEGDISPDKYGLQPHYFYPRPPRGGRHGQTVKATERGNFYPRPPRGGRPETLRNPCTNERFLSTPSARRATDVRGALAEYIKFLSTPSARRATYNPNKVSEENLFLSTPSARRATRWLSWRAPRWWYFYPRPPRGGRRRLGPSRSRRAPISIHALREEGDCNSSSLTSRQSNFYPRPPRGGRPACLGKNSFRC